MWKLTGEKTEGFFFREESVSYHKQNLIKILHIRKYQFKVICVFHKKKVNEPHEVQQGDIESLPPWEEQPQ